MKSTAFAGSLSGVVWLILIGALCAEGWGGVLAYKATVFFEGEMMHDALMAAGDAGGGMSLRERVEIKMVWVPFVMGGLLALALDAGLVRIAIRLAREANPPRA